MHISKTGRVFVNVLGHRNISSIFCKIKVVLQRRRKYWQNINIHEPDFANFSHQLYQYIGITIKYNKETFDR